MKGIQMGIFDIPMPKVPSPKPKNNDPALLNFFEDIDGKKNLLELNQWSYKHRNRIRDLPLEKLGEVVNHLNKRMEELR